MIGKEIIIHIIADIRKDAEINTNSIEMMLKEYKKTYKITGSNYREKSVISVLNLAHGFWRLGIVIVGLLASCNWWNKGYLNSIYTKM